MGQSHSDIQNQDLFKEFKRDEWSREMDCGLYELWQNSRTGELCEAYKLDYIPQEQELQHYRFRHYNQNADNFVEIRYVDVEKRQTLCSHGQSYVLTEFIPVKLSEMSGLSNVEAYSILRAAYRAFHTMEAFHGPFVPDEDLIGINLNGRAKIWLNRNHSKNKADNSITAQIWQKHMGQVSENVRKIVEMMEQRIIGKQFPSQFREYFYNNVLSFSQASEFVQQYCEKYRIVIPDAVEYLRHVKDAEIIKIVNQYNARNSPAPLSNLQTLAAVRQNYQFSYPNGEIGENALRRNGSHQNFTYHHSQVLNRQVYNVRSTMNGSTLQRPIISPAPQGSASFQIVVPNTTLRPTYFSQQNGVIMNARPGIIMQSNPRVIKGVNGVAYESSVSGGRMVNYQSMQTPQHVANSMAFMHPRRIAEFQQPVRDISQPVLVNLESQVQPVRVETSDVKPVEDRDQQRILNRQYSIHQKIREFQNQENQRYNIREQYQNQASYQAQPHYQPQSSTLTQHEQQLHEYINNDSNYQQSEQQVDNHTSQPDWENIQHHEQVTQRNQQQENNDAYNYQFKKQQQHHKQPSDISPIKQNQHRNIQEFQNHIAMLSHYADPSRNVYQGDQNQNVADTLEPRLNQSNDYQSEQLQEEQEQQQADQRQIPVQEDNTLDQQDNTPVQEDNTPVQEYITQQSLMHHLGHQLQSSQRMRHLSSKNNSINRGMHGESSGTLVIHQSRENLYQGVNQDKLDKIVVTNIQQQSQQSENDQQQNQEYYQQQYYDQEERQDQYDDQRERENERERQYVDDRERQYTDQNENQYYDGRGRQRDAQQYDQRNMQDRNRQLQFRSGQSQDQSQHQSNNQIHNLQLQQKNTNNQQPQQQQGPLSYRSINRSAQVINSQQEQQYYQQQQQHLSQSRQEEQPLQQLQEQFQAHRQDLARQYQNLHFRNQSQDLYQYTPLESVLKNDSGQHYHYGALPRPQYSSSGVQELVQIEKHQDIENYIRNKYSDVIYSENQPQNQPFHRKGSSKQGNRAMTFAKTYNQENQSEKDKNQEDQSSERYQRPKETEKLYKRIQEGNNASRDKRTQSVQHSVDDNDYLDVGNLQKSLDQKYKKQSSPKQSHMQSPKISHNIRGSQTMSQQDGMNVAALQQKLQKFEQRQSIQRQKSQRKLQSYNEDSSSRNNELNFHELDNIVQLMDRKIQQSQKKQRQSYQELKDRSVSEFSRKENGLENVQLETSIINVNQELSLKDIPVLGKDRGSSSIPQSGRDRANYYGFDSEDFATGREENSYQYNFMAKNQSYNSNNKRENQKYTQNYDNISPTAEIQRKNQSYTTKNYQNTYTSKNYQNDYMSKNYQKDYSSRNYQKDFSSKNYQNTSTNKNYENLFSSNKYENTYSPKENLVSTKNYEKIGIYVPTTVNDDSYRQTNDYSRKSSRRSTKNNEDAKRIADKIASKYDKYINGGNSNSENEKPFTKKSYYDSGVSYDSSKNLTSGYQTYNSKYNARQAAGSYQPSSKNIQSKISSYLNPIQELHGENNVSPYKEQIGSKRNENILAGNPLINRQNFSRPSNQSSRIGSKNSLPDSKTGKNSRVSYDELRDLLWK